MKKSRFWLLVSITTYIALMTCVVLNRHYTFRTNGFDLGWFAQAIWTTSEGYGILYTTIAEHQICVGTHFGAHFSPILLFLVPLYKIIPKPETLLIVQTIVIGLSAYPLFLLSEEVLNNEKISLGLVILYLLSPLLHGINGYDFHATPLAMPFIFLTALFLEKRQYSRAWIASQFVLLTKEDAGLALISLGAFYLLRDANLMSVRTYKDLLKRILNGSLDPFEKNVLFLALSGFMWTMVTWKLVIPFITGFHMTSKVYYHNFPCPQYVPMKILYFIIANITLGVLTLLRPKYYFLLTFVPWLEILLSCQINMFRLGFQYPYMVLPLSMISIVYSLSKIRRSEIKSSFEKIFSAGLITGIIFSILTTPILPVDNEIKADLLAPPHYYKPITDHDRLLMAVTKILGSTNLSILTQNDIFPHLSNRLNTYVIWTSYCNRSLPQADIILVDNNLLYSIYNFLIKDRLVNYTKIYEHDGIEVWVRNDISNTPQIMSLKEMLKDATMN